MYIREVNIENFKCFKGKFNLKLEENLNIIVGDNEAGKSTILEAIHLVLTGILNGKYLRNELTEDLFNNEVVAEYIANANNTSAIPPHILIEVFIGGDDLPEFEGDGNSKKQKDCGISLKIAFNNKYDPEYAELVKTGNITTIPIEYYDIEWNSCARDNITNSMSIPIKSAFIDSSNYRYQNGSDICISHIIKNHLSDEEMVGISQVHRGIRDFFMNQPIVKEVNEKIKTATNLSNKEIKLSINLPPKNAWETNLVTYLDNVPFQQIGKGEQCVIKTKLALSRKKSQEANLILMEEPENHLSHTKLNQLTSDIKNDCNGKQIIISTHSSFVANKLGLDNLILLKDNKTVTFKDLDPETYEFFEKVSGYDTLRLILCKKAILVEGDSDELIIQKAYMLNNENKLPIEDRIEVISVGTSFLRFLKIAEKINQPVVVVTDNDGDPTALNRKYNDYLGENNKENIKICFDQTVDTGDLKIGDIPFNYNTLEPKLLKVNSLEKLNEIFGTNFTDINDLHKYMRTNKTECALKIFDTQESVEFPQYILDSIN